MAVTPATDAIEALVRMAAGCGEAPSLAEIDGMLSLLSQMPDTPTETVIKDALLEMRTTLTAVPPAA